MLRVFYCLLYLGILGLLCIPAGRLLASNTWNPEAFPFKEYRWEDGGRIYERIFMIKKWKDRVPDVSRWIPGVVPSKKLVRFDIRELNDMIQETCVAELTHLFLCILSVPVLFISPGITGVLILIADVVFGNLMFVVIQRYNRFRYVKVRSKCESIDTELQYRDRT